MLEAHGTEFAQRRIEDVEFCLSQRDVVDRNVTRAGLLIEDCRMPVAECTTLDILPCESNMII